MPGSFDAADVKNRATLEVRGMHCASCASRVEKALRSVPGVSTASVNLLTARATIEFDPRRVGTDQLADAVRRAGYDAEPVGKDQKADDEAVIDRPDEDVAQLHRRLVIAVALLTPLLVATYGPWLAGPAQIWAQLLLAAPLQAYVGWPYFVGAWRQLRHGAATMDTLIALGTLTAFGAGVAQFLSGILASPAIEDTGHGAMYFADAAMILTFVTLGKWLEGKARRRAGRAIRRLLDLRPPTANVRHGDDCAVVPVEDVSPGQIILVRPGEKVPLDATIESGVSSVDQSWLTGESMPVDEQPGDEILAGTLNLTGSLVAKVARPAGQTALARVIELVRRAQESKPRLGRLADRVVAWFVPVVLVVAAVTLAAWGFGAGDWAAALRATVAVLVVACPCALGLATPTAVLVASGYGAEHGILVKDAQALETAARLDVVVLDKTGTLTENALWVTNVIPAEGVSEDELLATAAEVERLSTHPAAIAIVNEARRRQIMLRTADGLEILPGSGVRARLDGQSVWIGRNVGCVETHATQTALAVEVDGRPLGVIGLSDALATGAREAVAELHRLGVQVRLLSGDRRAATERIAAQLGIDDATAEVLPEGKQKVVRELQRASRVVAMVGDGINDAAALAAADVGVAIGTGADVAIETADVVLAGGDLRGVGRTIRLGRATVRTIRQNLAWAFVYNVILLPVAAGAFVPLAGLALPPSAAAAAMAASSVSVVANSLLLRARVH